MFELIAEEILEYLKGIHTVDDKERSFVKIKRNSSILQTLYQQTE